MGSGIRGQSGRLEAALEVKGESAVEVDIIVFSREREEAPVFLAVTYNRRGTAT
jgi:hypothetical protein